MSTERTDDQLPPAGVVRLRELTHELSTWVGIGMDYLVLARGNKEKSQEYLAIATDLSIRATQSLRGLMLELARLEGEIAGRS